MKQMIWRHARRAVVAFAFALSAPCAATQAQEAAQPQEQAQYEAALKKAVLEFSSGHWTEAKAFFLRAHAVRPSARTFRGLALVSYELREYVAALGYLERALASSQLPLTEKMREHAVSTLDECKSFITYVTLICNPGDLSVRVDGQAPAFDATGALMLDPGEHELRAEAVEHEPETRTVQARGGERLQLTLTLRSTKRVGAVALPAQPERSAAPRAQTQADSSLWSPLTAQRVVGLSLASGAVVAAGLGTAFSIVAGNENATSKPLCPAGGCDSRGYELRKSALKHADVASVSFVVAGVLLGAAVATYLTAPLPEQRTLALEPAVSKTHASLMITGTF